MAPYKAANNKNDLLVMNVIRHQGPISRNDIAKLTNLTHPTITNITNKMIDAGLLIEYKIGRSTGGRPPMLIKMCPDLIDMIIIYIRSNHIVGYLVNSDCLIKYEGIARILKLTYAEDLALLLSVIKDCQVAAKRCVAAISVIVCGSVNVREGLWAVSSNIGWSKTPLKKIVEDAFGIPAIVEYEANVMAIGEYYYGAAKDVDSMIFLKVGHGIDAGLVFNGKLYGGTDNCAGQIGHMTINFAIGLNYKGADSKAKVGDYGAWVNYIKSGANATIDGGYDIQDKVNGAKGWEFGFSYVPYKQILITTKYLDVKGTSNTGFGDRVFRTQVEFLF